MLQRQLSNTMNKIHNWKAVVLTSVLLILLWGVSIPVEAQAETPEATEQLCQIYHLRARIPANVYSAPDNQSRVIGRLLPDINLCVYGISEENPEWVEVNPDPNAPEIISGYILLSALRVGEPGTIANPNIFCDAWQVRTTASSSINVRSCPSTGCGVVTTQDPGDIICVDEYDYSGGNWSFITQIGTGANGWVRSSAVGSYFFDERVECEDSYLLQSQTNLYSCADATCITDAVLGAGTPVCRQSDSFEGATWVRYSEANEPVGWIRVDLLNPIESDTDLQTVSLTQDVNFADQSVEINTQPDPVQQAITAEPTAQSIQNSVSVAQAGTATPLADGTPIATPLPGLNPQIVQVCPVGASPITPGQCVTVTPPPLASTPQPGNGLLLAQNISFGSLFIENVELVSPQGTAEFFFVLPNDWVVRGPVTLVMDVDYSENINASAGSIDVTNLSSRLDIRLDGVLASSLSLNSDDVGRRQLEVLLPTELLADQTQRFHTITLELNARDYCQVNSETRLFVNSTTSYMRAVYEEIIPALELARYPVPLYNSPIGAENESVWFVLPDRPENSHLQVAASIAAGLGRLTGNDLELNAVFASQVTADLYRNNNLILIGEPSRNSLIADLYSARVLPSILDSSGQIIVDGLAVSPSEGVIQLAANPQNPSRTILVATATGEQGLQRAGQALGGPPSLIGLSGPIAVVSDTTPRFRSDTPGEALPVGTYRLRDFGIEDNVVLVGTGLKAFTFAFDVPIGGELREDAYLELLFNSTSSVNLESSNINVLINGNPISGISLSQVVLGSTAINSTVDRETVQVDFNRLNIRIPQGIVEPGQTNEMTFLVDMQGEWGCDLPNFLWSTISNESVMFLPQETINSDDYFPLVAQFPIPFNLLPNLQDVWISLPEQVTDVELGQLVQLMGYIGNSTPLAEGVSPVIQTGGLPPATNLGDYHFIVLGRPSQNAFLASINGDLPQPFFASSDELVQEFDDITYRVGPGLNIGVLQILESPWNPARVMFVMTGTSQLGQEFTSNAIFDLAFGRAALNGNIVFVSGSDANAVDTRFVFNELEILQNGIDTTGAVVQPATATPVEVATQTLAPTATIDVENTAEVAAVATGIFTQSPEQMTATPLPTLPALPTRSGVFAGDNAGVVGSPPWLMIGLGLLGVTLGLIVIMAIARSFGRRSGSDE